MGKIKAHYRLVMLFLFNREGNGGSGRLSNFTWSSDQKWNLNLTVSDPKMLFRATLKLCGVWRGAVTIFIEHIPCAGHFGDTLKNLIL